MVLCPPCPCLPCPFQPCPCQPCPYKDVEVIWIFSVGRVDTVHWTGREPKLREGTLRGPRGNKNIALVWSSNYVSSPKLPLDGDVHKTFLSTASSVSIFILLCLPFFRSRALGGWDWVRLDGMEISVLGDCMSTALLC